VAPALTTETEPAAATDEASLTTDLEAPTADALEQATEADPSFEPDPEPVTPSRSEPALVAASVFGTLPLTEPAEPAEPTEPAEAPAGEEPSTADRIFEAPAADTEGEVTVLEPAADAEGEVTAQEPAAAATPDAEGEAVPAPEATADVEADAAADIDGEEPGSAWV
jgi:ribonuclease E